MVDLKESKAKEKVLEKENATLKSQVWNAFPLSSQATYDPAMAKRLETLSTNPCTLDYAMLI